ncbi:MAG: hypothetical protein ROR55_20760 [Devosia sp.]
MKSLSKACDFGETFIRDTLFRGRKPSIERFEIIADRLQTSAAWLLGETSVVDKNSRGLTVSSQLIPPILGKVAHDVWYGPQFHPQVQGGEMAYVLSENLETIDYEYGLTVVDDSIDEVAGPGDILLCRPVSIEDAAKLNGQIVIVQRTKRAGDVSELTARRMRVDGQRVTLSFASTNPNHRATISIDKDGNADGEHSLAIIARVVGYIHRFPEIVL